MSEIEKKKKEMVEKWKHKMLEQGFDEFTYNFYRQNKVELFNDYEELFYLRKLEEFKQAIKIIF